MKAFNFTPWLAEGDNLALLADAVGAGLWVQLANEIIN